MSTIRPSLTVAVRKTAAPLNGMLRWALPVSILLTNVVQVQSEGRVTVHLLCLLKSFNHFWNRKEVSVETGLGSGVTY